MFQDIIVYMFYGLLYLASSSLIVSNVVIYRRNNSASLWTQEQLIITTVSYEKNGITVVLFCSTHLP